MTITYEKIREINTNCWGVTYNVSNDEDIRVYKVNDKIVGSSNGQLVHMGAPNGWYDDIWRKVRTDSVYLVTQEPDLEKFL